MTTRLAFKEASNVAELSLIREPERRFYRECRLAGFDVAVYDESSGGEQVFDVGQLRLRFSVTKQGGPTINSERIREQASNGREDKRADMEVILPGAN